MKSKFEFKFAIEKLNIGQQITSSTSIALNLTISKWYKLNLNKSTLQKNKIKYSKSKQVYFTKNKFKYQHHLKKKEKKI